MAAPNEIARFMHCRGCVAQRPRIVSPRDWANLEVGLTDDAAHLQVWCKRCEQSVAKFALARGLPGLPACGERL